MLTPRRKPTPHRANSLAAIDHCVAPQVVRWDQRADEGPTINDPPELLGLNARDLAAKLRLSAKTLADELESIAKDQVILSEGSRTSYGIALTC